MTRYPFPRYRTKRLETQRNVVIHNSLDNTAQYKFRNRGLTSTVYASWPIEDYNNPEKRKEIARKLRILRKLVRG